MTRPSSADAPLQRPLSDEARLARLLDIGRMCTWDWDLETDVVSLSENGVRFWGRAIGRPADFQPVMHPEDAPKVQEAMRRAVETGSDFEAVYRLKAQGGVERWVHSRGEIERSPSGTPSFVYGVTTDVTEQVQARTGAQLLAEAGHTLGASLDYQTTLSQLAQVLIPRLADWYAVDLLNDCGELERVSVFHREPGKVALGKLLHEKYPPQRDAAKGVWRVLETGRPDVLEQITDEMIEAGARDAEHLELLRKLQLRSYVIVPLTARGTTIGAITLVYAESGRRYFEPDIALAQDIARRAAFAVDNARLFSNLQLADRRKDEFLAMLAHELRNPLAPIATAAALVERCGSDERSRRAAEIIGRQARHMTELIDDLLDVSRVTRGMVKLERTPVNLKGVLTAAVEQLQPLIEANGHALHTFVGADSMVVLGDRSRLVQAVANLLGNAAKYTPPRGRIELRAELINDVISVTVTDNGIGMEKSLLPHVFDLFVQATRTPDRSQGGLGIGLSLVRSMVRLHGGEATAYSAGLGKGSSFTLRLPRFAGVAQAEAEVALAPARPGGGRRILVVDDNDDAGQVLAEMLRLHGHTVQAVVNGRDALACAAKLQFEVFILDIGLPDIDGLRMVQLLRATEHGRHGSFIALTGYGQDEDRQRAVDAGFDLFMVKPPAMDTLLRFLADCRPASNDAG